ncbi:MAG: radical SAM protein [Deltaproteobacteria bacterium]|nr:radical SAM protein [Deltaproteobacteria bacterium]
MRTKEKLLLLYPGEFYAGNWGRTLRLKPHMVYIYSYLKQFFDVSVIDLENEFSRPESEDELSIFKQNALKRLSGIDADIVAISCWSSLNYLSTIYFAEKIKENQPDIKIIVGGYHPTFMPQDFEYQNNPFDHVVTGEIQNIFKAIHPEKFREIQTYQLTPDFLSYPYYDNQKTLGIFLGSGCPFNCNYCMEYKTRWSSLSVDEAITFIQELSAKISPQYITIFDACFGLNKKWRKAFLSTLAKAKLDCYFWLETRIDVIDEEDLELMAKLNVKIDFGIDSFSSSMLKIMNKTNKPDAYLKKFLNISAKCSQLGLLHDVYLIFDHPGETQETYAEFKLFFQNFVRPQLEGGYLRVKYQRFSFYPGNYIFNHLKDFEKQFGFKVNLPEWWKQEGNQYLSSRDIVPSIDENGNPFHVPLKETSKMVKRFNQLSKEEKLWENLHTFKSFTSLKSKQPHQA